MKKILLKMFVCSAVLLSIVSCAKPTDPVNTEPKVIDYRNKDANGNAISRAAASDVDTPVTFSCKFLDKYTPWGDVGYSYCSYTDAATGEKVTCDPANNTETFNKMKNSISFEDCEGGVKFKFTKPEGYGNLTWIVLQYLDGNGNRSTCIDSDDWTSVFGSGDFELVYPLVLKGKKANFWVMFGDGNDNHPDVNFYYEIMPAHGKGIVDDLPKKYDETKYVSITEGKNMNVHLTIPPKAENLKMVVQLQEQFDGTVAWESTKDINKLGYICEAVPEAVQTAALAEEEVDFTVDLSTKIVEGCNGTNGFDTALSLDYDKVFVEFWFKYTMEDYDGFFFATPAIKPVPVANTVFKKTTASDEE